MTGGVQSGGEGGREDAGEGGVGVGTEAEADFEAGGDLKEGGREGKKGGVSG